KEQPVKVGWTGNIAPKPSWVWWKPARQELVTQWRTTPFATDWNNDGLTDLVMLDTAGYLSFFERYKAGNDLLLKPGRRIFDGINGAVYNSKHIKDSTAENTGLLQLNNGK